MLPQRVRKPYLWTRQRLALLRGAVSCDLAEPGVPPVCGRSPFARYLWVGRVIISALKRLGRVVVTNK